MGRDFWLVWGIGPLQTESRQTVTRFSQSFHLLHLHQANWNKRMINQTHTTDPRQFNIFRHWLFACTHWLHGKTSLSSESIESITTTFFRYQPEPAANTETFNKKINLHQWLLAFSVSWKNLLKIKIISEASVTFSLLIMSNDQLL